MTMIKDLKDIESNEAFKIFDTNNIKKESVKVKNDNNEDTITFMNDISNTDVKENFYKSMMQNQFLHNLRNKNIYIAIQTINNEIYIGTLISFDEYTLHVYVEDKKFNSAMLFFKSSLVFIRVLTESAYQYYINKLNNETKPYKKEFKPQAKQYKTNTSYREQNPEGSRNFNKKNTTNDIVNTLSTKFNVNKSKRTDF